MNPLLQTKGWKRSAGIVILAFIWCLKALGVEVPNGLEAQLVDVVETIGKTLAVVGVMHPLILSAWAAIKGKIKK